MGGFDPPPRAFQARALPSELHDHGAGPGTRTRIDWVTKPVPIPLGPAGTSAAVITPRHPGAVLHRRPQRAAAARKNPALALPRATPSSHRSPHSRCPRERRASADRVARNHLLSDGSGGRCRTLISGTKTLRPAIGRLPSGRLLGGSWVPTPYTWAQPTGESVNTSTAGPTRTGWRHRLDSHQRGPGCNRVPRSSITVPGLRRRASNPRRRWLTATRSATELLRTAWAYRWECSSCGRGVPVPGIRG